MKNKKCEPKDGQDKRDTDEEPARKEKKQSNGSEPDSEGEEPAEEENEFEVRLPTMKW
jgi:hypothetical protein